MSGVNKCIILGNLGLNPTVTYTQSGTAVAKITVATSETWNDKNSGEKREKTEWHRITFFGKQAETVGKYMTKGSQIYVEGKLQTSQYEKDGITRYSKDIIASTFQFISGKSQSSNSQANQQQGFQTPQQQGFQNGNYQTPQQQQFQPGQQDMQQPGGGGFQNQPQTGGQAGFQGPPDDDIPFSPIY